MEYVIKIIKDLAHKVSEDYLLFGKGMNESLIDLYQKGEIENLEILKRICEHANQNVYLALFNDPKVNKSNIVFEIADFNKISTTAKESEEAMKDYNTPPEDFRSSLEIAVIPKLEATEGEKLGSFNEFLEFRQVFHNFLNRIGIMKTAEEKKSESAFNAMAHDAKLLVSNNESIGDLSKIATRYVKENLGGDFVKIAKCYDMIHKELINSGFFGIKTEFTKLSSQKINSNSKVIGPVHEFALSMAKLSGLTEMKENVEKYISAFDKIIKSEIKK